MKKLVLSLCILTSLCASAQDSSAVSGAAIVPHDSTIITHDSPYVITPNPALLHGVVPPVIADTIVLPIIPAHVRIPYVLSNIVINIPDVVVDGTTLKRTATLFTMIYNQDAKSLSLNWIVKFYSDDDGAYGNYLGKFVPDYPVGQTTSNSVAVNPATGQALVADSLGNYPMDYMGQYDFFNMIAEKMPLKVHQLVRQYGSAYQKWDK